MVLSSCLGLVLILTQVMTHSQNPTCCGYSAALMSTRRLVASTPVLNCTNSPLAHAGPQLAAVRHTEILLLVSPGPHAVAWKSNTKAAWCWIWLSPHAGPCLRQLQRSPSLLQGVPRAADAPHCQWPVAAGATGAGRGPAIQARDRDCPLNACLSHPTLVPAFTTQQFTCMTSQAPPAVTTHALMQDTCLLLISQYTHQSTSLFSLTTANCHSLCLSCCLQERQLWLWASHQVANGFNRLAVHALSSSGNHTMSCLQDQPVLGSGHSPSRQAWEGHLIGPWYWGGYRRNGCGRQQCVHDAECDTGR